MTEQARPITDHLRDGKNWLNGGNCCGQKDSSGTCAAPACIFGDALKWFFEAADEIDRQAAMRHSDQLACAGIVNEDCAIRVKLESVLIEVEAIEDTIGPRLTDKRDPFHLKDYEQLSEICKRMRSALAKPKEYQPLFGLTAEEKEHAPPRNSQEK